MAKTLDKKLKKIHNGKYSYKDFIIADAKDADMGGGIPATGQNRDESGKKLKSYKNLDGYLDAMKNMTRG
jgi:hypothetical protein